jgi:hypothetical protein
MNPKYFLPFIVVCVAGVILYVESRRKNGGPDTRPVNETIEWKPVPIVTPSSSPVRGGAPNPIPKNENDGKNTTEVQTTSPSIPFASESEKAKDEELVREALKEQSPLKVAPKDYNPYAKKPVQK